MAFKKTTQTDFGFDVRNAYFRVEGVKLVKKDKIQFQLRAAIDDEKPHFYDVQYNCDYDLEGENPIKQAYDYLKALPEFADAIDC